MDKRGGWGAAPYAIRTAPPLGRQTGAEEGGGPVASPLADHTAGLRSRSYRESLAGTAGCPSGGHIVAAAAAGSALLVAHTQRLGSAAGAGADRSLG